MSGPGYTYTTVSGPHRRAGAQSGCRSTSTRTRGSAWSGPRTDRPHLAVAHGDVSVSIGPQAGPVTAEDARIARHLAAQAAEYAAAIERLSAANTTAPESGASDEAAGDPAA